ncbi:MAG: phospholipid/cholesterol/gamma-HCH transport system substrate-binding protein [Actinomycetota bacterium]|nr:phospholipid/cholesterol/gamma-HCH transport system substrate-binding protein [Actinomycetota bacterium]
MNKRLLANLITVFLLGVLMVGWVVTKVLGGGFGSAPMTITADFAGSGGVFTNQEVTYRGVLIGQVGDMTLNVDGVDIQLRIDPEWKDRIPADVLATVQSKSAVGEQFVNLTPQGSATDDMLAEGDVIPRSQTALPVEFQALLRSLDKVVAGISPEHTGSLVSTLADGLSGRQREIASILASLGTLSEGFASVASEQQRLLTNAPKAGTEFLRTKDDFAAAISSADEVLAAVDDEQELKALFSANDRFARQAIDLLARHGDNLAGGIGALADFVDFQWRERQAVVDGLEYIPQFMHAVEDASILWRAPDGREFYRIRTGLIYDNVPSTWPCGYKVPEDYARLPHVRAKKKVLTDLECRPRKPAAETTQVATQLVKALSRWARANEAPAPTRVLEATEEGAARPSLFGPGYMDPFRRALTP